MLAFAGLLQRVLVFWAIQTIKHILIRQRHKFKSWSSICYKTGILRIFKCMGFVPSHYVSAINLDAAPSFSVFSEFNYVSQ